MNVFADYSVTRRTLQKVVLKEGERWKLVVSLLWGGVRSECGAY